MALLDREGIVSSLIEMHRRGYKLSAERIRHAPQANYSIYGKKVMGLYEAREEVARRLEGEGDLSGAEEIRRINAIKFATQISRENAKKREEKRKEAEGLVRKIHQTGEYVPSEMGFPQIQGRMSGGELYQQLLKSGEWLSGKKIADILEISPVKVCGNFKYKFPRQTIVYYWKKDSLKLYHKSVLNEYKRKRRRSFEPEQLKKLNEIADETGITLQKVKQITGVFCEDSRRLDETKEVIKSYIENQNRIREIILSNILANRTYTLSDLDVIGAPVGKIMGEMKRGKIHFQVIDGTRFLSGKDLRGYLENRKEGPDASYVLKFVNFFNPNLMGVADIINETGMRRTSLHGRFNVLVQENPGMCFRMRKTEERTNTLSPRYILDYLRKWEDRGKLQLVHSADDLFRLYNSPGKKESEKAVGRIDSIVDGKGRIICEDKQLPFQVFRILTDYLGQTLEMDDILVPQRDLAVICRIMEKFRYTSVDVGKRYSAEDVRDAVQNFDFVKETIGVRQLLGHALFYANRGLMSKVVHDLGLPFDAKRSAAEKGLVKAVEAYKPQHHSRATFATFAYPIIRREVVKDGAYRKDGKALFADIMQVSLDAPHPFIEGQTMMASVADTTIPSPSEQAHEEDLSKSIMDVLETLPEKQREALIVRFGLDGGGARTLEETGERMGLTRERVRQMEKMAMEKLSGNEKLRALNEEVFDNS